MISKVHFKSESDRWQTPQEFWEMLDREFHFDIDVALLTLGLHVLTSIIPQIMMVYYTSGVVLVG